MQQRRWFRPITVAFIALGLLVGSIGIASGAAELARGDFSRPPMLSSLIVVMVTGTLGRWLPRPWSVLVVAVGTFGAVACVALSSYYLFSRTFTERGDVAMVVVALLLAAVGAAANALALRESIAARG